MSWRTLCVKLDTTLRWLATNSLQVRTMIGYLQPQWLSTERWSRSICIFSDIRRHPPEGTPGIVVLRLHDQTLGPVRRTATALATLLATEQLLGRLWVLDEHRLRIWPTGGGAA